MKYYIYYILQNIIIIQ